MAWERESNGFVADLLDNSNKFHSVALNQFKLNKKLLGTKVSVERISPNSKYREVFGGLYTSENLDDSEIERFSYVILLNMNDMKNLLSKNVNSLEIFDNENILRLGDVLSYRRRDQEYQFKVSSVETFSEAENVLYKYTLLGLLETQLEGYSVAPEPQQQQNQSFIP
jgi:hypothetical protein